MDVMNAALGGMQNAQSKFDKTAQRISGASTQASDSTDLSTDMVDMLAARNQFQTNARVFQTADEMQKRLLDIMA
jgi:flagellar hook protein FlgE